MIQGIFHQGSGLGNQLHRYVATRVLAREKKTDFAMLYNPDGSGKVEGFKGAAFMQIQMGVKPDPNLPTWTEKKVVENGVDVRGYDPEFNFVQDNMTIEGEFQDPKYFEHRMDEVEQWLPTTALDIPDDVCVIGFRGGEFTVFPDLFLTKEYWDKGIKLMRGINPNMRFEVHTDDPTTAKLFFPDYKVIHNVGINWRSMRYAKYAIIANSSFYILPRMLGWYDFEGRMTIAPRYWARRNTKVWALPQNFYRQFHYL